MLHERLPTLRLFLLEYDTLGENFMVPRMLLIQRAGSVTKSVESNFFLLTSFLFDYNLLVAHVMLYSNPKNLVLLSLRRHKPTPLANALFNQKPKCVCRPSPCKWNISTHIYTACSLLHLCAPASIYTPQHSFAEMCKRCKCMHMKNWHSCATQCRYAGGTALMSATAAASTRAKAPGIEHYTCYLQVRSHSCRVWLLVCCTSKLIGCCVKKHRLWELCCGNLGMHVQPYSHA